MRYMPLIGVSALVLGGCGMSQPQVCNNYEEFPRPAQVQPPSNIIFDHAHPDDRLQCCIRLMESGRLGVGTSRSDLFKFASGRVHVNEDMQGATWGLIFLTEIPSDQKGVPGVQMGWYVEVRFDAKGEFVEEVALRTTPW